MVKKKECIAVGAALVVLIFLFIFIGLNAHDTNVSFQVIKEKDLPKKVVQEVIPEYRELERGLACADGENVYVIVMRGEKPTEGYEVSIKKLKLTAKKDKSVLTVYADFTDPKDSETRPQVISYPYSVIKAEMTGLPDQIVLKRNYVQ